jgi:hypothetical protein
MDEDKLTLLVTSYNGYKQNIKQLEDKLISSQKEIQVLFCQKYPIVYRIFITSNNSSYILQPKYIDGLWTNVDNVLIEQEKLIKKNKNTYLKYIVEANHSKEIDLDIIIKYCLKIFDNIII